MHVPDKKCVFSKTVKTLARFSPAGKNMLHRLQVISIGLKVAIKTTQAVQIVTTIESPSRSKPVLRLYHLAASHMYGCQKKGWPLLCESRYGLRIWHREVKTRNFARQLPAPCTMELEDLDSMEDNSASKIKRKQTNLGLDRFPFGSLYLLTRLFCTCTHLHRIKLASSYMTLFRPT